MSQLVSVLTRDSRVDDLKVLVTDLASRPVETPELTSRLDDLSRRVDALVADAGGRVGGEIPDELRTALEELAMRPPVDAALAAVLRSSPTASPSCPLSVPSRTTRRWPQQPS